MSCSESSLEIPINCCSRESERHHEGLLYGQTYKTQSFAATKWQSKPEAFLLPSSETLEAPVLGDSNLLCLNPAYEKAYIIF